jgi:hypothetical protein
MKLANGLLLAGLVAVYLGKLAFGESGVTSAAPQPLSAPSVQYQSANPLVLWKSPAYSNSPGMVVLKKGKFVPAARALKSFGTNSPVLFFVVPNVAPFPKPGVYKTEPCAGIVIVPEKHPDDRAIVNLAQGDFKIPVIQPELRFLPLNPVSK